MVNDYDNIELEYKIQQIEPSYEVMLNNID